jgi:23S rRNA (cytosine1962-C5)-methyltransferase
MTASDETTDYRLIDFGNGRKLERFGNRTLDRPCPAAENISPASPHFWQLADARYQKEDGRTGRWHSPSQLAPSWQTKFSPFTLQLKLTPFGHVGVFPEQAENWDWISRRLQHTDRPLTILNLFAYTGASTLAAAIAGAQVVHVDGAQNVVQWARQNAELSGLAKAPIRWITEDARKFVRREAQRGNRYDGIILDPPSYGHGPKGEPWKMAEHFCELLAGCRSLIGQNPQLLLVTCHSPGYDEKRLRDAVGAVIPELDDANLAGRPIWLTSDGDQPLPAGFSVRWPEEPRP